MTDLIVVPQAAHFRNGVLGAIGVGVRYFNSYFRPGVCLREVRHVGVDDAGSYGPRGTFTQRIAYDAAGNSGWRAITVVRRSLPPRTAPLGCRVLYRATRAPPLRRFGRLWLLGGPGDLDTVAKLLGPTLQVPARRAWTGYRYYC